MSLNKSVSPLIAAVAAAVLLLSACSSDKACPTGYTCADGKPPVRTRSADFQKRVDAERAAEDMRDRNSEVQEQLNSEQRELRALRADRAAQREERRKQRTADDAAAMAEQTK